MATAVEVPEYEVQDDVQLDRERTALIVVDMQNDFVSEGGSLVVADAKATIPRIQALLELARGSGMHVVFSQDTHDEGDPEWQIWPEHARRGTWGWEIVEELAPRVAGTRTGAEAHARAAEVAREIGCAPDQVETVAALLELGVPTKAMRGALERGRLEDAIFDAVLDPERAQRTVTPAEIEARGGLPVAEVQLLMQTAGLPPPAPDEASFTEEETELFLEVARLREIWTPE